MAGLSERFTNAGVLLHVAVTGASAAAAVSSSAPHPGGRVDRSRSAGLGRAQEVRLVEHLEHGAAQPQPCGVECLALERASAALRGKWE
jgi:hypothetical protein